MPGIHIPGPVAGGQGRFRGVRHVVANCRYQWADGGRSVGAWRRTLRARCLHAALVLDCSARPQSSVRATQNVVRPLSLRYNPLRRHDGTNMATAQTFHDPSTTPFAGPSAWRRHRVRPRRNRPQCGARCRDGTPCEARVVWDNDRNAPRNDRCRMHGGASTGAKTPEGRARSLANLVQFRTQPEQIDADG